MRGLKPGSLLGIIRQRQRRVARSAPLMRGLKRSDCARQVLFYPERRAIRPAYEGIETVKHPEMCQSSDREVARSAPLMRGLKPPTGNSSGSTRRSVVARSAPLMRGLKLACMLPSRSIRVVARSAPLMRGLKPVTHGFTYITVPPGRAIRPAYEGIETVWRLSR